jgi:hypothetical protein
MSACKPARAPSDAFINLSTGCGCEQEVAKLWVAGRIRLSEQKLVNRSLLFHMSDYMEVNAT